MFMKFYEYICRCLRFYGCKQAFGVPGSLIMPVWQHLTDLNLLLCSHEQEAAYMASGYAKASGELTAVITTGSPGVTNCITGIAGANMDSVPLIYISGKNQQQLQDLGSRQEESTQNRSFRSTDLLFHLTKQSIEIADITLAAEQFRRCCETAVSGRPGCVHVCIPLNLQSLELPPLPVVEEKTHYIGSYPEMPDCNRPLIILGWGCRQSGATEAVYRLAEWINAPILVTVKAYCCIKREHPFYIGKLGYGYNTALEKFLKEYNADQVLVFGSSMSYKDISPSCKSILGRSEVHVYTLESGEVKNRFESALTHEISDLKGMLDMWLSESHVSSYDPVLSQKIADSKEEQAQILKKVLQKPDVMASAIDLLNTIKDNVVISADAGNNLLNTGVLCNPEKIESIFLNDGIRSMGSSICEAAGMAIARPDKYYLAVVGDGAMLMNGNILYVAARQNLPIAFLVMNNESLGRVRVGQKTTGQFIGSDLGNVDFTLYAKAFGIEAHRTKDVQEWFFFVKEAVSLNKPMLLELLTDKDEIPLKLKIEGIY